MVGLKSESKQLTLPLEVINNEHKQEYADIIQQNWKITFSRQYMTSIHARRVMGFIASQIKEDGEVREYYQISAEKVIQETDISREEVYRRMKGVMRELAKITYYIEDEKNQMLIPRHLLDTTRFENPSCYMNGKITVAFNPQLKGIVDNLAHYSTYELNTYVNFSSWYSMRLYELLHAYKDLDCVEWEIDKYREWMGCGYVLDRDDKPRINKKTGKPKYEKYGNSHSNAIMYTTREPLKDFKGTDLEFTVKPVYAKEGKGRRPIEKILFIFTNKRKKLPAGEQIEQWKKNSDSFPRIYERLKGYQVTDDIIVKYSRVIGKEKILNLLHQWDLRQIPTSKEEDKIKNPERYCNKVIADMGKALLADNKQ